MNDLNNRVISMPLIKAEAVLKEEGKNFIVRHVKTFKLNRFDTEIVVKANEENGLIVLYVCYFLCNAG